MQNIFTITVDSPDTDDSEYLAFAEVEATIRHAITGAAESIGCQLTAMRGRRK